MEMQIWGRETNYTSLTNQIYTFCTLYKKIRSRPAQGRIQGGGDWGEFALTKVQDTLFTITFMSYMLFHFLYISIFLDQVQPRRLFFFARFPPLP